MRRFALIGFALWLVATVALRLIGQFLFASPIAVLALYLLTALALLALPYRLYAARALGRAQRIQAAVSLALPGLLLDVLSVTFVAPLFPNIPAGARLIFAGWLLWAYAVTLLSGFLPVRVPASVSMSA